MDSHQVEGQQRCTRGTPNRLPLVKPAASLRWRSASWRSRVLTLPAAGLNRYRDSGLVPCSFRAPLGRAKSSSDSGRLPGASCPSHAASRQKEWNPALNHACSCCCGAVQGHRPMGRAAALRQRPDRASHRTVQTAGRASGVGVTAGFRVSEGRRVGVTGVQLQPQTRDRARVQIRRDERRLAGASTGGVEESVQM